MIHRTYRVDCDECGARGPTVITSEFDAYSAAMNLGILKHTPERQQVTRDLCHKCRKNLPRRGPQVESPT